MAYTTIDLLWVALVVVCVALRFTLSVLSRRGKDSGDGKGGKGSSSKDSSKSPEAAAADRALCLKYLPCFLVFKAADWMQGPYLYDVYLSKQVEVENVAIGADGQSHVALEMVPMLSASEIGMLFLTGFATNAVFSSFSGALTDRHGRRAGAVALGLFTVGSAMSVSSNWRPLMYLGRVCGGASSSLLYTAPESWLNAEAARTKTQRALGTVFGSVCLFVCLLFGLVGIWDLGFGFCLAGCRVWLGVDCLARRQQQHC